MVYFLRAGENGPVKIGFTNGSLQMRIDAIQMHNHEELILIGLIGDCGREKESEIHEKFSHLCIRGEWFRMDKELEDYVSSFRCFDGDVDSVGEMTRITTYVPDSVFEQLVRGIGRLTDARGKRVSLSAAVAEAIQVWAKQIP